MSNISKAIEAHIKAESIANEKLRKEYALKKDDMLFDIIEASEQHIDDMSCLLDAFSDIEMSNERIENMRLHHMMRFFANYLR